MRWLLLIVIILIILAGLITVSIFRVRANFIPTSYALSDGSVIHFKGVTYGTTHYSPGAPWLRFVPAPLARLVTRGRTGSFTTASPMAGLWFQREGSAINAARWHCTVVLEDGFETPCSSATFTVSANLTNILEAQAGPIPRRGGSLRLRVYDTGNGSTPRLLGEFSVRNPAPSSSAAWPPQSLPQTKTEGELEATLLTLTTQGMSTNASIYDAKTFATFNVKVAGAVSTNWRVERVECTDATGNTLTPTSWGGPSTWPQPFQFSPPLWPSEVYRIRAEFARSPLGPFEDNECWSITNLAIPTNGATAKVEATTNLNGFTICLHGLSSPNGPASWPRHMARQYSLDFAITPEPKDHRFTLLRINDDRGRLITECGRGWSTTNYSIGLNLSNDMRRLTVTVAMPKSRFLEFTAQPTRVATSR